MGQTATSITEQIQLLKARGMVFDCEDAKNKHSNLILKKSSQKKK